MGTRFVLKRFCCPVCHNEFDAKIVEAVVHQGQDSDFFPHYVGEDPLPFFLVQCPKCNYCAYPEDYTDTTYKPVDKETIRSILEQPLAKKLPLNARRYYLAAKIYEKQKRNPYYVGNLYLRGSWVCRTLDDRKSEIELQQLAVKFLRQAVEHSTITNPDNLPVITYLIGELYRRLEDKDSAREWFESVQDYITDPDQNWILELTRKQAELNEYLLN